MFRVIDKSTTPMNTKVLLRLYSISQVFWPAVFGEINMCELLILKLNVFLNASDFSSIVWRWIHSFKGIFFGTAKFEKPRHIPQLFFGAKNQLEDPSWFFQILDRDFRPGFSTVPYRIQPQ